MKLLFFVLFSTVSVAFAQTKKPAPKVVKPATVKLAPVMTGTDSLSYAIGLQVADFYKNQGIAKVNSAMVKKAYDDIYGNKKLLITPEQANTTIQEKLQEYMNQKSNAQKAKGLKFLEENKKRPGIITTASGLQYEIITAGTGPIPKITDTVMAHYAGSLVDGKEFDNSYKRGEPLEIPVSGVIRGWVEALQLMPVGSKWKLFIPSELGYGDRGAGGDIPGGATLIFTIELVKIVNQ